MTMLWNGRRFWNGAARVRPGQQFVFLMVLGLTVGVGLVVSAELEHAPLQARYLSRLANSLTYKVQPGPSERIRFPESSPYDDRLGYSRVGDFVQRLQQRDFAIVSQARISPTMARLIDAGLFPIYREKDQAGLQLWSDDRQALHVVRYPEHVYANFRSVPPLLIDSLLFVENRTLLDKQYPNKNPALEWKRFSRAIADQAVHRFDEAHDTAGGSTLATQIEKYRHSPDGRTSDPLEKLKQMASASVRAYLDGSDTLPTRQQIVVDYLNTVPLSAKAGYGEVQGIGDGLWAWYGRDFNEVNRLLGGEAERRNPALLQRRAQIYKEALSLIIAQRRPSFYLLKNRELKQKELKRGERQQGESELEEITNSHLRVLADAGVIDTQLRDAALPLPLQLRRDSLFKPLNTQGMQKASVAMRTALANLIGLPSRYDMDRLDLAATSTLNGGVQQAITTLLTQLKNPDAARAAGLYGFRMLGDNDDPDKLIYSFVLFERGDNANYLRVQTDNFPQPFDINTGAKLDLGSTAKLRTLISYLQIVANLHRDYAGFERQQLLAMPVHEKDYIMRWALNYLATESDRSLRPMLEAALDRVYSASPYEAFFTGGGLHTFANFDAEDNGRLFSVRSAFRDSVNLVFVRLMRDVVRHYMFTVSGSSAQVLADTADPRRKIYLSRFADRDGAEFVARFYKKYRKLTPEQARTLLLQGARAKPAQLATAYLSVTPGAQLPTFSEFMRTQLPEQNLSNDDVANLYEKYLPEKFSLADRGYISGIHPLELWLVNYLQTHPGATLQQSLTASADDRQAVYAWLFKTRYKNAQDKRIHTLLEVEAFLDIAHDWQRLGYPFATLTPSYATAIGASGDRPIALAELMGIIVNKGMRLPSAKIQTIDIAVGTPYETHMAYQPHKATRVLPAEIVDAVQPLLVDVAENGTAVRIKGVFKRSDGSAVTIGGKTGTGDHRYDEVTRYGQVISSRVVDRSATFLFMLDDRYFGTLTAFAHEPYAANYHFTSTLTVQLLKALAPVLTPLLDAPRAGERKDAIGMLMTPSSPMPIVN